MCAHPTLRVHVRLNTIELVRPPHAHAVIFPFNDRAFRLARFWPAIEIQVEILDALGDKPRFLFGCERRINANFHRKSSSLIERIAVKLTRSLMTETAR